MTSARRDLVEGGGGDPKVASSYTVDELGPFVRCEVHHHTVGSICEADLASALGRPVDRARLSALPIAEQLKCKR